MNFYQKSACCQLLTSKSNNTERWGRKRNWGERITKRKQREKKKDSEGRKAGRLAGKKGGREGEMEGGREEEEKKWGK